MIQRPSEAVGIVIRSSTLVPIDHHGAISLVVSSARGEGTVDGDLVVIGAQAMSVGVGVRKQPPL